MLVLGTGAVEPIPLSVKTCREGLGQESERRRKAAEQRAMRVAMARKRQKHEAEWRENVRSKVASREVDKDLAQSQNVCEQLDSQLVSTIHHCVCVCQSHFHFSTLMTWTLFRSTLRQSRPNKAGLKCPSICTSVRPQRSFFDFSEIWHISRGR